MKNPKFIIAAYCQPSFAHEKWKARGVNTLLGWEGEAPYAGAAPRVAKGAWEDICAQRGLFFVTLPGDTPEKIQAEGQQKFRLAFQQDDEPDLWRQPLVDAKQADGSVAKVPNPRIIQDGKWLGWTRPEILEARYKLCKANAPDVPVFTNFAGPSLSNEYYTDAAGHRRYLDASDWIGHDWYPKNKNAARYPNSHVVLPMKKLLLPAFGPRKPQIVFIECSNQGISKDGRTPTPDDIQEQVDLAVANGAAGICYFAHAFNVGWPGGFDATPPENVERITRINADLNARFNGGGQPTPAPIPTPIPVPVPTPTPTPADPVASKVDQLAGHVETLSKEVADLKAALQKGFSGTVSFGLPK